jgi:uncharacterized protein
MVDHEGKEAGAEGSSMQEDLAVWRRAFVDYLVEHWATTDGAHDMHHLHRVWKTCLRLKAEEESPADALVLLAACYFHDLVSLPKNDPARASSSLVSADQAAALLRTHFRGFPPDRVAAVHHAIHAHSFSAQVPVRTAEAAILQDADRMEALGALGIARLFYTAGRMNSSIVDAEDPLALRRPADDRRYAVDHIAIKLMKLPATMNTAAGRNMAAEAAAYIQAFRDKLLAELDGGAD